MENFQPSKFSRICSDHFEEHCFNRVGKLAQSRLNDDAVPTIQRVISQEVLNGPAVQLSGTTEEVWIPSSVVGMDVESASSQVSNSIGGSQFEKKRKRLMLEHNYDSKRSPRYWMTKYRKCADKYVKLNRKFKTSKINVHRL